MIKKFFLSIITLLLFSLQSNAQSISMIGDAVSGWGTDVVMTTTDNVNYTLSNFTFSNGGAKFRQDASWGTNWGANAFPSGTANLNGSNIPVVAGIYDVSFNRTTRAYSFTPVVTGFDAISISGTAGPGLNADTAMLTVDGVNYTLNDCALTAGTLIFRKNNSSAVTWGSASFPSGTATQGGAAMVVTAGTYDISFNKTTGAYTFAFAKIGIIGSATPGGWNTDTLMSTTDGINYILEGLTLITGELKFRQNQNWAVNWGAATFPFGTATLNNVSNIPATAGTYSVSFNKNTGAFSFSAGYPVISLTAAGNTAIDLITIDGENYYINNYSITGGDYLFTQSSNNNTWGTNSFPSGTATLGGDAIPVLTGDYNITFNRITGAFSFNYLTISVIGSATPGGWNADTNLTSTDGVNYSLSGLTLIEGELKFRQNQNWAVSWGTNAFPIGTATLNGSNIPATAGTYSVSFNKNTGAFSFSAGYPVISLTAAGNTAIDLITIDGENYYINNYSITGGDYLFTQSSNNNTWGTNSFPSGTATLGGDAIPVLTGDYNITFNRITGAFSFNYLTISVIGSATPGGWNADTNLTSTDGVNYSLSGLTLIEGELKFRQGNAWEVSWGSSSFPGGTANNSNNSNNIVVSSASNYTVHFNRITGVFYFYDEVNLQVTSTLNLCKGTPATSLSAHVHAVPGSIVKYYTRVGTTTTYTLITTGAPTPSTSLISTRTYYMSQTIGGIEGPKVAMVVNVFGVPTAPTTLTGTAAQGPLVGTTTTATYATSAVTGAASYLWTVPAGVNIVSGQGTTSITVDFENVTAGAGAMGAISVKSVNENGCSSTTAKSMSLTKALPAAPAAIKMTDASLPIPTSGIATALTSFAKYMGTDKVLTLTATPSATASSYVWELPTGVNQLSGGTSNVITVNFLGVTSSNSFNYSTTAGVSTNVLRIGVKARNGVGVSTTNNAALLDPTTTSTAKLLTLKAVKPAAASAVAGQIAGLCGGRTYTYTITDTALASSYTVTAPAGAVVNFTSTLVFTVTYPSVFVINSSTSVPNKSLVITSVNGMGSSASSRTLTLSTAMPAIGTVSGGTTYSSCNQTFSIPSVAGATTYTWTVPTGATIVSGQNTNSVVVNYGTLTGNQTIKVVAANICRVSTAVKSVTLTRGNCPTAKESEINSLLVNEVKLYPNPANNVFNVELNASADAQLEMNVYSMNGSLVSSKNIQLSEGNNTITEDISYLSNGIYFVKFNNTSTNEMIIKKLIKQ